MKRKKDLIYIRNVYFQTITEQVFNKLNISNLLFLVISQSGAIDTPGNIYIFTSDDAFFMDKSKHNTDFIDKILSITKKWKKINLYFCDYLIINPKIYDSFTTELFTKNIRDFWFETAVDIYKDKYIN